MQGGREVKGYKVVKNTAIIREEKKNRIQVIISPDIHK